MKLNWFNGLRAAFVPVGMHYNGSMESLVSSTFPIPSSLVVGTQDDRKQGNRLNNLDSTRPSSPLAPAEVGHSSSRASATSGQEIRPRSTAVAASTSTVGVQSNSAPKSTSTVGVQRNAAPTSTSTVGVQSNAAPTSTSTVGVQGNATPTSTSTAGEQDDAAPTSTSTAGVQGNAAPTSTSTTGVQGDAAPTVKPAAVVDGSSNTSPRPQPSPLPPLAVETPSTDKRVAPMALVSTGVSASDVPPPDRSRRPSSVSTETTGAATEGMAAVGGSDAGVMTMTRPSSDSGVQVGGGPVLVETSDGSTQADSGDAVVDGTLTTKEDGDGAGRSSVAVEAAGQATEGAAAGGNAASVTTAPVMISDGNTQQADSGDAVADGTPATRIGGIATGRQIAAVADHVTTLQERSTTSNVGTMDSEDQVTQPADNATPNSPPSIDAEIAQSAPATTTATYSTDQNSSHAAQAQQEEVANASAPSMGGIGEKPQAKETTAKYVGGRDSRGKVQVIVSGTEKEDASGVKKEHDEGQEEVEQEEEEGEEEEGTGEEGKHHDGGGRERNSAESRWSSSPESGTAVEKVATIAGANMDGGGRGRYESVDGETLLGKLLDEDAPSAMFEDDHENLLRKLLRVRDDDHVSKSTGLR